MTNVSINPSQIPVSTKTLGWLLLCVFLITLPHATHLPIWVLVVLSASSLWRWQAAHRAWKLPPTWMRMLAVVAGIGGVFVTYRAISGHEPGVALLVVMLSLKFLELRTQRDELVVIMLGYFLLLTTFMFTQNFVIGVYMFALAAAITALLVNISEPKRPGLNRRHWRTAMVLMAQGLPLMVVLFFLFPRIDGALWGISGEPQRAVTGLSDSMSPGAFSDLTRSEEVAFRVNFESGIPAREDLYWRGPVFWRFDGVTWRKGGPRGPRPLAMEGYGEPTRYTVTMEPNRQVWLFALDIPTQADIQSHFSLDYRLERQHPIKDRLVYNAVSYLDYSIDKDLPDDYRKLALQLPQGRHMLARDLAEEWRDKHGDNTPAIIGEALKMFREQAFYYTLSPPPLPGDSVDDFLFDSRRGFCEHYASAFTVLMRAAGIPARIVTGYQGGLWNKLGDYFMVRQADAHAWSEVWVQGRGWVRVDPTAAVAPERVESGLSAALRNIKELDGLAGRRMETGLMSDLWQAWDALQTGWNRWVVGYNANRQRSLMEQLGMEDFSPRIMVIWMLILISGLFLIFSALMFIKRLGRNTDPVQKAWTLFLHRLETAGVERRYSEGPMDLSRRALGILGKSTNSSELIESQLNQIVGDYIALRYGPNLPDSDVLSRFQSSIGKFRP